MQHLITTTQIFHLSLVLMMFSFLIVVQNFPKNILILSIQNFIFSKL